MSRFLKVIVNIILVGAILTAAALLVPPIVGIHTFIMDDPSMNSNLATGSVTYAMDKKAEDIKNGDKVLEQASSGNYVYRVTNLNVTERICTLSAPNTEPKVTKEANISNGVAKVIVTIPFIGYTVMAMKSTEGLIIIGLAVVFVILLFVLSEVCKKDDDDDEYEYDEEYVSDDEDEEEDDDLTRKERKQKRKEEKEAAKFAKKEKKRAKKNDYDDEEDDFFQTIAQAKMEEAETKESVTVVSKQDEQGIFSMEEQLASMVRQFEQETMNKNGVPVQETGVEESPEEKREIEVPPIFDEEPSNEPVIPNYTVQELVQKAKASGANPEVLEDEESGVTLVDYSQWLKNKK